MKHNDVIEAAAIGVPDEVKVQSCHCFVVLKRSCNIYDKLKAELASLVTGS